MYKADSYQQSIGCFQTCGCCWGIQIILWIFRHQCKSTYFSVLTGDWLHNIHIVSKVHIWFKNSIQLITIFSDFLQENWIFNIVRHFIFIWKIALIILRNFLRLAEFCLMRQKITLCLETKVGHKIELEWRVWHMVWIAKWSV